MTANILRSSLKVYLHWLPLPLRSIVVVTKLLLFLGYINLTDMETAFNTTESILFRTRQPTFASICLSQSSYFSSLFSLLLRLLDTFVVNLTHPFTVALGTVSQLAPTASTSINGVQLVQHLENPVRAGYHSAVRRRLGSTIGHGPAERA